jgi:hypothetical protein
VEWFCPRNTTEKLALQRFLRVSGGDGGELNSVTLESPISLTFSLLDQLTALGDTARQLRKRNLKTTIPGKKNYFQAY